MKFFYNNQLIRTSRTHEYKFALIGKDEKGKIFAMTCSATKEGCQKEKNRLENYCLQRIENNTNKIKAIEAGKSGYYGKDGRKSYYYKLVGGEWDTVEGCKILIEEAQNRLHEIEAYEIVELETRA